ncbi:MULTISPECIES: hypothetical protein [Prauserella salsuginis group]|uniref:PE family protein n=1 Tax=Prauserella salsuginis TaxID=387889 RepID=A0ABW6G5Q3_9PSEU|nr:MULTISPECIES: hypothetical protein [Prauserella salsuginis group]MCR3719119.1 hypothetical protein [Prauserella flava]MCR3735868.1 hypothetical protein [Prauserella salsuginis]
MTGAFGDNPVGGGQDGGTAGAQIGAGVGKQVGGFLVGVENMKTGAEQMVNAAKSGGFRTDPEGVKQMTKVCDDMIDEIERKQTTFELLAQEPKLGSGPYAKQVAQHVRASADGDQGVIPQLQALKATLSALNEALYRASGQYAEAEEAAKLRDV